MLNKIINDMRILYSDSSPKMKINFILKSNCINNVDIVYDLVYRTDKIYINTYINLNALFAIHLIYTTEVISRLKIIYAPLVSTKVKNKCLSHIKGKYIIHTAHRNTLCIGFDFSPKN